MNTGKIVLMKPPATNTEAGEAKGRVVNKYNLPKPPALNTEVGEAKSCVIRNGAEFTAFFNDFMWLDFHLSLWHLATDSSPGGDIGIYTDDCEAGFDAAVIVPYCEITLIPGDRPAGRFLPVKQNYLYRPEDRRVDFFVVRPEAEDAFLRVENLEESGQKTKLFDNLWVQIVNDL